MTRPLPFADYDAIPGLSQSALKPILTSPLEYQRQQRIKRKETPALRFGRAVDCAAFTPRDYAIEFSVLPSGPLPDSLHLGKPEGKARKAAWIEAHPEDAEISGDEWRAKVWTAEHPGVTALSRDEHDRAWHLGEILHEHELTRDYFKGGRVQVVIEWTDKATGIKCKGRADLLPNCAPCIVDLKSTRSADRHRFGADIAKFGYHFQGSFYRTGWHEMTGEWLDFKDVAIESLEPHDVGVFLIDGDALQKGNELVRKALDTYARCRDSGKWPGRYSGEESAMLPVYALAYEADEAADDSPISY